MSVVSLQIYGKSSIYGWRGRHLGSVGTFFYDLLILWTVCQIPLMDGVAVVELYDSAKPNHLILSIRRRQPFVGLFSCQLIKVRMRCLDVMIKFAIMTEVSALAPYTQCDD